jgi:hypothetical protein
MADATIPAGRSVKLFLADGTAHGIVVAEIGNWTGKVLAAPRGRLGELLSRPEAGRTGIYVLLGPDPERPDGLLAYIGEADDIAARMRNHLRSEAKDFADRFALIVSSDDSLTKGHARYLEGRLIRLVKEAGTVQLTNDTAPDFQRLPEADKADMEFFLGQVVLVLPLVGFDLFRRVHAPKVPKSADGRTTFAFSPAGASARAQEGTEGFVVLAGSTARRGGSETFPAGYRALRDKLLANGQLAENSSSELYRFVTDVVFSSSSAAASIIAARSAGGPLEWKLESTGQTYRDWRAARLDLSPVVPPPA